MCRYGTKSYKLHFVCFNCRKGFKQYPPEDQILNRGLWDEYVKLFVNPQSTTHFTQEEIEKKDAIKKEFFDRAYHCPECRLPMVNMGFDFKTPKKGAKEEWKIIYSMLRIGVSFHSCGCYGPGFIPKTDAVYEDYLIKKKSLYQDMLDSRNGSNTGDEITQYLKYWTHKINLVNEELVKLGRS